MQTAVNFLPRPKSQRAPVRILPPSHPNIAFYLLPPDTLSFLGDPPVQLARNHVVAPRERWHQGHRDLLPQPSEFCLAPPDIAPPPQPSFAAPTATLEGLVLTRHRVTVRRAVRA